jgi:hypothetical protein
MVWWLLMMTTTTTDTMSANDKKVARVQTLLAELFNKTLRRGYFGTVSIEWQVVNGTVQAIRSRMERIEK